jgi:hypothetical protein
VPNCTGKNCGDDGCGGSCGSCSGGETCQNGVCTTATCDWDPSWQQGSGANNWWVEYTITDGTVTAASLEIVGAGTITLARHFSKWAAPSSFFINTGTRVILHATSSLGQTAQTRLFEYLVDMQPQTNCTANQCVPNCTGHDCGDDGCGGSCGSCSTGETCDNGTCTNACRWNPSWQQGSGANNWWVEYTINTIGNDVTAASLEVVGRGTITLARHFSKWAASSPFRIDTGASVILHATKAPAPETLKAQTKTFRYLVDMQPSTDCAAGQCLPGCASRQCGNDGCGGSCGTCSDTEICSLSDGLCVPACGTCPAGTSCYDCSDVLACLAPAQVTPNCIPD